MDVSPNYKERFQNGRKKKLNSPFTKTTSKQIFEPFNCSKNKIVYNSPRQDRNKETRRNFFLLLKEPLLFNCIEQNKMKQILMYKAHSVENVAKDGSESDSYKTLEELLAKSIQYDGEPIYLVSEPLKLMTRLKKEKEIRILNAENYHKCKHNLITSAVYKKLLIYKKAQMLRNTQHEKRLFRTEQPKTEYTMQINTINEIPYQPPKTTRSCLDLPKNFAASFMINDFDVSKYTLQETFKRQMLNEPFVTLHRCSNLTKNFSSSITRRSFDMEDLFGGHKSNFHRRVNITALKHVNVKKLVSSVFRHFFHFYSVIGGNLRSGTVITRSGSNYWLQVAGVAKDSCTLKLAGELFTTVAGKKVVLNIFDYIKFLIVFARTRRLIIAEVVKQMMVCEELSEPKFSKGKCKRCKTFKNQEMDSAEFYYEGNYSQTSQSLPNIQP